MYGIKAEKQHYYQHTIKCELVFLVFSKQLIIIFLFANLVFGMHFVQEIVLHENRIDCTIIS